MKIIADKKKQENIVEYILYLYRMEDLIRAYHFDMQEVEKYVLGHQKVDARDRSESLNWLKGMARDMKEIGIQEKGHLPHVQRVVDQLASIHWELIRTDPTYFALYKKTQSHLLSLISEAGDEDPGHEVQLYIHTLYGLLLSKLNGRKAAEEILEAASCFGDALAYLNAVYMKAKPNPSLN
ncbi:protein of unknown function [Cyclobacterium lianum]|uniref:DUF4924 domain-containing protein n=1 Tax=Cyclobacterium lianum TaxID=388280 RepID=A0A1M7Q8R3_9BACT|nr:DUF4924 family protein [Cyclobacterium lianum]SHN27017.1 protein of unknown function [Cyclobacterium lianum]